MGDLTGMVLRRAMYGFAALFVLVSLVFVVTRLIGDPVVILAGSDPTEELLRAIETRLGLDKPLWQQYINYIGDLLRGDLGESYRMSRPALGLVLERLPATLALTGVAMGLAALVAVPVGVIAAIRPGSLVDSITRVFAVLGQSTPVFYLGILLIILFAVNLGVLPAGGRGTWRHLILPGATLSIYSIPLTMRLTRSAMLEVLNKDYIRTARSKGVAEWRVVVRHGLRNALIPVITVLALRLGHVITGAIVLEEVFAYPGLGRLAIQAMLARDFPVMGAFVIVVAVAIMLVNLLADVLYTVADPRVRVN